MFKPCHSSFSFSKGSRKDQIQCVFSGLEMILLATVYLLARLHTDEGMDRGKLATTVVPLIDSQMAQIALQLRLTRHGR